MFSHFLNIGVNLERNPKNKVKAADFLSRHFCLIKLHFLSQLVFYCFHTVQEAAAYTKRDSMEIVLVLQLVTQSDIGLTQAAVDRDKSN
jgi:hypothetical protein